MAYFKEIQTAYYDSANLDAFGRLRVASPQTLFDAQFTYNLQPLVFETVGTTSPSATITHDSTNRRALFDFTNAAAATEMFMQTYEYFRYQPGKGHEINITFNFGTANTDVTKYAGYGDNDNSIRFYQLGTGEIGFAITSGTGSGNQTAAQSSWNVDKLDGTGKSGLTLDITTDQILYIDMQALYVGRVRCGFSIDGQIIVAHEFLNANALTTPYIQSANLPIRVGMINTGGGTASGTMSFNCSMVASSGGIDEAVGYEFSTPNASVTAGNGTQTHLLSIRPRTTFNSITNRTKLALVEIDLLVTGNNPVYWEIVLDASFSVAPTWANVNATYSAMEYATGGTYSTNSLVVNSGYIPATANTKASVTRSVTERYPITLNSAGSQRGFGTLSLLVTGLGGTSTTRGIMNFKEIR